MTKETNLRPGADHHLNKRLPSLRSSSIDVTELANPVDYSKPLQVAHRAHTLLVLINSIPLTTRALINARRLLTDLHTYIVNRNNIYQDHYFRFWLLSKYSKADKIQAAEELIKFVLNVVNNIQAEANKQLLLPIIQGDLKDVVDKHLATLNNETFKSVFTTINDLFKHGLADPSDGCLPGFKLN